MREKNMRYIEDAVDSLSAGIKPSFKRTRKIVKPLTLVLVVLVCASVGLAATLTFYMKVDASHSVGRIWLISDNIDGYWSEPVAMEEITLDFITSGIAGDSDFFLFNITLSGNSVANKSLEFVIFEDLVNGVNLTILQGTDEINNLSSWEFEPGVSVQFKYLVTTSDYTPEGSYATSLTLKKP